MKKLIIISDFDGTITKKDSLVEILNKFASPKWQIIARLITKGRLGTKIGLRKEFDLCRVTKKEFVDFLIKNIKIDTTFKNFLEFCKKNNLKFLLVSGGFTLNIETLFKKFGIENVPYYANIITFRKDRVKVKFPYKDAECRNSEKRFFGIPKNNQRSFYIRDKSCKTCSLCKAPYIRKFKKKGYFTIYIGDSVTDRCPGRIADLVFAKHDLAKYCKAKGIAYIPYNTFGQIKKELSAIISSPLWGED